MKNSDGRLVVVYGGSFDPPTIYHHNVCKFILRLNPSELMIMPAYKQPLKDKHVASFDHRVEMLNRMVHDITISDNGTTEVYVSTIEKDRLGSSYTIDTIRYLQGLRPHHNFMFVMGSDSLLNLGRWKDPEEICNSVNILSIPRDPAEPSSSMVRAALAGEPGLDLTKCLLPSIDAYINAYQLYG